MMKKLGLAALLLACPVAAHANADPAASTEEKLALRKIETSRPTPRRPIENRPAMIRAVWIVFPVPLLHRPGAVV